MKFSLSKIQVSANPYREWLIVLTLMLALLAAVSVVDVRLFLGAVGETPSDGSRLSAPEFSKEELARAALVLKDKAQKFDNLKP